MCCLLQMPCPGKTLDDLTCIKDPGTTGSYPQVLISDGNGGTKWSTSLLGETAAVLSAYVEECYSIPIGGWLVPANTPAIRLVTGVIDSGDVVLGLDFSATTNYAFQIFNPFTGQNQTNQKILVSVNYSVNLNGANNGDCGVWIQIVGSDMIPKPPRYGLTNQPNIPVADGGNSLAGSTIIGLEVGESAAFYLKNTSNQTQIMIGGDILTEPLVTKFQTALIN